MNSGTYSRDFFFKKFFCLAICNYLYGSIQLQVVTHSHLKKQISRKKYRVPPIRQSCVLEVCPWNYGILLERCEGVDRSGFTSWDELSHVASI